MAYLKIGQPPGTLHYTGIYKAQETIIDIISFDEDHYSRKQMRDFELKFDPKLIYWINITGLNDLTIIQKIGEFFHINKLALEDIIQVSQRPKLDFLEDNLLAILKMIYRSNDEFLIEHLSLFKAGQVVITFQETTGDIFDSLRERLEKKIGIIRSKSSDYLFYSILDVLVDHYNDVIKSLEVKIDELETAIIDDARGTAESLHYVRKELLNIRTAVIPLREIVDKLKYDNSGIIIEDVKPFYNDIADHLNHMSDDLMMQRDVLQSLSETNQSNVSNKMNKVMTILTIFSAIFIPLSFLTGVFGMNFSNMPLLHSPWGFPAFIISSLVIALGMFGFFKLKGWFK